MDKHMGHSLDKGGEHQTLLAQIPLHHTGVTALDGDDADAVSEEIQKLERELEYERRGFWGSIGSRVVKLIDSF